MAELVGPGGHTRGIASTSRTDRWWISPVLVMSGLTAFIAYATWAALQGAYYWYGTYLSPFYSPVLFADTAAPGSVPIEHAWFGAWPSWWPAIIPASPAILILIFPGLFRFTCYYYRKAYYRAFTWTPPACTVGALPQDNYKGESKLLLFQNLHRYALYPALAYIVILYYDAFIAFFRGGEFGVGVGSLVLLTNATLLAGYTLGCHSLRHLIGGKLDCYSCSRVAGVRHGAWQKASILNRNHMFWAWSSLFWVAFTDLYVRLVSMGVLTDLNTWQ
ncbi:MAG: succinate dehydrogenase [Rhodothermia bacterium]